MLIAHNRLIGMVIIALLLFLGYHCICGDWERKRVPGAGDYSCGEFPGHRPLAAPENLGLSESAEMVNVKKSSQNSLLFSIAIVIKISCPPGGQAVTAGYALSTLPDLRQRVQTCILLEPPFTLHFTLLTLAFHIVLVFLLEWLTLLPKRTPLPQISHLAILPPPQHLRVPTLVFYCGNRKSVSRISYYTQHWYITRNIWKKQVKKTFLI